MQLLKYPSHFLNVGLSWIFSIDQDVIQVHYNKDIKLFNENFIDVALKTGGCIEKAEGHYLVLKVAVSGTKGRLLFIIFSNLHSMIGTNQIQLGKLLGPA